MHILHERKHMLISSKPIVLLSYAVLDELAINATSLHREQDQRILQAQGSGWINDHRQREIQ